MDATNPNNLTPEETAMVNAHIRDSRERLRQYIADKITSNDYIDTKIASKLLGRCRQYCNQVTYDHIMSLGVIPPIEQLNRAWLCWLLAEFSSTMTDDVKTMLKATAGLTTTSSAIAYPQK